MRGLSLTEKEVYGQLEKIEETDTPFLWRYTDTYLLRQLKRVGILSRINELGYPFPRIRRGVEEGLHLLRLEVEGEEAPLIDLRVSEESRVFENPHDRFLGSDPLAMLVIQWVSLQHVRGVFSAERPQLPGQSYPGLGLGRKLYRLLWRMAHGLGKDGLSAYPMYYHNAVYYSDGFSYLVPQKQGELVALMRDLSGVPLMTASEGINDGRLRSGSNGEVVDWNPGEMFAAVSRRLGSYMNSREYKSEVKRAASEFSFRLVPT
jgi:hypothetical protein